MNKLLAGVVVVVCGLGVPAVAVAAPVERRLHSNEIEASSFLWNDWNKFVENYHPNYVGDDDPATAWVEGAPGSGAGEWIQIHVTPLDKTTHVRLHVRDGYQKSPGLFAANARAKQVTLRLLPGKAEVKATFADHDGWQDIAIDQASGPLTAVEVHVDSVYEGKKYEDLCISDIQVFATSETPDNPALEKSKQKALLDWRASRIAASKMFSGKVDLPLAPSYEVTEPRDLTLPSDYAGAIGTMTENAAKDPVLARDWKDALAIAVAVAPDVDKLQRAQLAPAAEVKLPEVDGVQLMTGDRAFGELGNGLLHDDELRLPMLGTVASLFVDQLRVLDLKDKLTPSAYETTHGPCKEGDLAWVKRMAPREATGPAAVRALVIGRCGRMETREGHIDVRVLEMLVYAVDGRLALVIGPGHADAYRWGEEGGRLMIVGGHALTAEGGGRMVDVKARTAAKPPAKP